MDIQFDDEYDFNKHYGLEISLAIPQKESYPFFFSQMPFDKRVIPLRVEDSTCTYLVDGLIRVTGSSDTFRISALNHWESKKQDANWWWRFHIVAIVGSIALLPLSLPAAVIGAACFVFSAIRAFDHSYKASAAQRQIDQWNRHPAQPIADERSRAYSKGFFYALNHNLKGTFGTYSPQNILHPAEVTWLYEKVLKDQMNDVAVQQQRQNISIREMSQWVEQFILENPLSASAIAYAYEPSDPKRQILEMWANSFSAYKQDVTTTQLKFKEQKASVQSRAKEEIRLLEEQRKSALSFPLSLKNERDAEARKIRSEKLKEELTDEDKKIVEDNCKQALSNSDALYKIAAKPIDFYYDERIQDVKNSEALCLQEIEQEKALGISPYFEPGLRLFADAVESWQSTLFPLPSAPPRELLSW